MRKKKKIKSKKKNKRTKFKKNKFKKTKKITSKELIFKVPKKWANSAYVDKNKYDLVIIDSYSSRSMRVKAEVAPSLNYVGMYGFFNGPEVNRTLFSFHQMNNLLGNIKEEDEILNLAKNHISISIIYIFTNIIHLHCSSPSPNKSYTTC